MTPEAAGTPPEPRIAVVGGGWAGLAAAITLADAGHPVVLYEAAPALGGRARTQVLRFGDDELALDNGQHLLIGAYRECLRLMARVGVRTLPGDAPAPADDAPAAARETLRRFPMRLQSADGLVLPLASLPAPWHLLAGLLRARGLALGERAAIVRMMLTLRRHAWSVPAGETVDAMLARLRQPQSLRRRLWEPLAIAALNTPAEEACAQAFATVLRDALGAQAPAADFVLPASTLGDALPAPAARWLLAQGAEIRLRTPVRALVPDGRGWRVRTDDGDARVDGVVLATPPAVAARLLSTAAATPALRQAVAELTRFSPESLATVYLGWRADACPPLPRWIMLDERIGERAWGQWLFDRGVQRGWRIGAVVVSARGRHADVGPDGLADGIAAQVSAQLGLPPPQAHRTIVEKRATFRCRPDRPRPTSTLFADAAASGGPQAAAFVRLMIAGDYAWPAYPATLEAAVRSGIDAAHRFGDAQRSQAA